MQETALNYTCGTALQNSPPLAPLYHGHRHGTEPQLTSSRQKSASRLPERTLGFPATGFIFGAPPLNRSTPLLLNSPCNPHAGAAPARRSAGRPPRDSTCSACRYARRSCQTSPKTSAPLCRQPQPPPAKDRPRISEGKDPAEDHASIDQGRCNESKGSQGEECWAEVWCGEPVPRRGGGTERPGLREMSSHKGSRRRAKPTERAPCPASILVQSWHLSRLST